MDLHCILCSTPANGVEMSYLAWTTCILSRLSIQSGIRPSGLGPLEMRIPCKAIK
jgi:hypothetical protein